MKIFIALLLTATSLLAADVRTVRTDIRIVGTEHVDLTSIHEWVDHGRKGTRPMEHWKFVSIESIQPTAPWPTCYIQVDQKEHKTVYVKNLPKEISAQLSRVNELEEKKKALTQEIETDKKDLQQARAVDARKHSPFAQNRREMNANLKNKQVDLGAMTKELNNLKTEARLKATDLAMFTGQIYNKLEVWDFGARQ